MSLVEDVRKQVESRLKELRPLVDEYQQLEKMASGWNEGATEKVGATTTRPSTRAAPRRGRGRPAGSTNRARGRASGTRRGGRRAGGANTRADQALKLVRERPGITIPDIAQAMGIKQNYLYRVLPRLEQEGQVARDGRGWKAKDDVAATTEGV